MTARLTLLLGGARSGKSRQAVALAQATGGPVVFLATGSARDEEMADRIARHQEVRPPGWRTIERSRELGTAIGRLEAGTTVLLDSLGDLVTDYLLAGEAAAGGALLPARVEALDSELSAEIDNLLQAYRAARLHLIVVSNEVGLGLVPPYPLGRHFRDLLGRANQRLAAAADAVYLMIAGLPLDLKARGGLPGLSD